MYKAIFCLAYYGLMRVGGLTEGPHSVKACNVHIGNNKDKILIILYSSKTHDKESHPQEIKITSVYEAAREGLRKMDYSKTTIICPFKAIHSYAAIRGGFKSNCDHFFVFADGTPVKPVQFRKMLRSCVARINLNPKSFDCHSFRIGRTGDLLKMGVPIEKIKLMGHWKSNVVYKYIRNF